MSAVMDFLQSRREQNLAELIEYLKKPAISTLGIGVEAAAVFVQIDGAFRIVQAIEDGAQAGAGDPFQHGVGAGEDVLVFGGPDIEMGGVGCQQVVVEIGILHPAVADGLAQFGRADGVAAGAAVGQGLAHQVMRCHIPAQRGLHGQAAAGREHGPEARHQFLVIGQPLDDGVGVED